MIEHIPKNDNSGMCGNDCIIKLKKNKSKISKRKREQFNNDSGLNQINKDENNENDDNIIESKDDNEGIPIQKVTKGTRGFVDDFSHLMTPGQ